MCAYACVCVLLSSVMRQLSSVSSASLLFQLSLPSQSRRCFARALEITELRRSQPLDCTSGRALRTGKLEYCLNNLKPYDLFELWNSFVLRWSISPPSPPNSSTAVPCVILLGPLYCRSSSCFGLPWPESVSWLVKHPHLLWFVSPRQIECSRQKRRGPLCTRLFRVCPAISAQQSSSDDQNLSSSCGC